MIMKKILLLLIAALFIFSQSVMAREAPAQLDKDVVVLYTNDVHCGVDDYIGYAGLAAYKQQMIEQNQHTILVDAGDSLQGGPIGTISKGAAIINIMNKVGYDIAIPGNHEFDYGVERFLDLSHKAQFPYLAMNFIDLKTNKTVFAPYKIISFNGVKIAFLGIATPQTITSSAPSYFQDEQGGFIYSFLQDATGLLLYREIQAKVDEIRKQGVQYVIAIGHLGIEADASPWMSSEIITNTTGIDAFIDGHSHSTIEQAVVKNKAGKQVLLTQTGTKLKAIGVLRIDKVGNLSTKLVTDYQGQSKFIKDEIQREKLKIDKMLNQVVANSKFLLTDAMPDDLSVRIIRNAETNLGDLCADAYRIICKTDIGLVNGGGIRSSIPAGKITNKDTIKLYPFGNKVCIVEATGQQVLDALELGARFTPKPDGGFLQVSGLTYEIHTYLPSTVSLDKDGLFQRVNGEYRVKNVEINGQPLILDKTYTIASSEYIIRNKGNGYTMFDEGKLVNNGELSDSQLLAEFFIKNLQGIVPIEYQDPFGQDRIREIEQPRD